MDKEKLDKLHGLMLDRMIAAMGSAETATPGMIQCVLRYLADNEIEALPMPGSKTQELANVAPFKLTGARG